MVKNIILTGISAVNRRVDLQNEITAIAPHVPVRAVTTCSTTASRGKGKYYTLVSKKEFTNLIKQGKLTAITILSAHRMFGILHDEYDFNSIPSQPRIIRVDYNGLKDFFAAYGTENLKKYFSILSLMPPENERMENLINKGMPWQEAALRIKNTRGPEQWFFLTDPRAQCIDATVTSIGHEADLASLARAVVDHATGVTEELILPKPFVL